MENLVLLLILLPCVMAILMAAISNTKVRAAVTYCSAAIIAALSIYTAVTWLITTGGEAITFDLPATEVFDKIILVGDFALMFLVIYQSFKHKKYWVSLISIVQTVFVAALEIFEEQLGITVTECDRLRIDWLTFIMILIVGIIGVAIGIYAVGYLHGYHHHHATKVKDRRGYFFAIMFIFYGAMFGLVTSQSLIWIYFFWEVTSVCSFLLIGYTQEEIAINNSFKALWMNLLGGCGIAVAIGVAMICENTVNLYDVIDSAIGQQGLVLVPIAMLAFASLTKSAQLPFSGWLLGAMVAPTPSSALLHSATMVKAGVYMLVRIAMAMQGNSVGTMVYLIGGITFFAASCLAISQSDGKKVLAYSTISNLGLIVACAGAASPETVWAAVFLIIYHAVSKSMLFQCVGAIENTTGSRNIETMQGLAMRYPKLGMILMIGIAGMYLAPFGMLVSKWAALKAFIDVNSTTAVVMVLLVSFGSATTMFYWTKWFGKILGVKREDPGRDLTKNNEYVSMFFHAILLVALCLMFPILSKNLVGSLVADMFGEATQTMSDGNILIVTIMIFAIFIVPTLFYLLTKNVKSKEVIAYMGGANTGDNKNFINSNGDATELHVANWYLEDIFAEKKFFGPSVIAGLLVLLVCLAVIIGGAM